MANRIKLTKSTPGIKELLAITFPEYKGRKFELIIRDKYQMADYWSEGSRRYARVINLQNAKVADNKFANSHPGFTPECHAEFDIPEGVAVVEHNIFCGHDLGIKIYTPSINWLGE